MRLNLSEDQLGAVLDTVSDAVFIVDRDSIVCGFNRVAEEITGQQAEHVIGKRCRDVFDSSGCDNGCPLKQTLRSGQAQEGRLSLRDTNHQERCICLRTAALRDAQGEIVGGVQAFQRMPAGMKSATLEALPILDRYERCAIEEVLRRHRGNQVATARDLGISRTTLWRKMHKLGIRAQRGVSSPSDPANAPG